MTVDTGDWTITKETAFEFDINRASAPSLSRIDDTHYLCAYGGQTDVGLAVVLVVNPISWMITKGTPYIYDSDRGVLPTLAMLDPLHHFCAYTGKNDDGWMVTLTVNRSSWTITKGIPWEYDPTDGVNPAITKINDDHFLCVYQGRNNDGWAVVLSPVPPIAP